MEQPTREHAIILSNHGGPEKLVPSTVELPPPGPGEIRIRHNAIAVNFHDCYVRSGQYRTLTLPGIPGLEAVGQIEAIGPGVEGFTEGDRIGWISPSYGGYAAARNLPAELAYRIPDTIGDAPAAASIMKALTVRMLVRDAHRIERGQSVLVHAAAGGVGQLLTAWVRHLGARVIASVGSDEKAKVARRAGADDIILYREEDLAERVREITGGQGVAAAYDSVGADTFDASLASLDYGGTLVSYGQSSGPVAPFALSVLAGKSLKVARPIVFHSLRTRALRDEATAEVFAAFADGIIQPIEPMILPLADAAEAHRIMEAGRSPGGIVLVS